MLIAGHDNKALHCCVCEKSGALALMGVCSDTELKVQAAYFLYFLMGGYWNSGRPLYMIETEFSAPSLLSLEKLHGLHKMWKLYMPWVL